MKTLNNETTKYAIRVDHTAVTQGFKDEKSITYTYQIVIIIHVSIATKHVMSSISWTSKVEISKKVTNLKIIDL